MKAAPKSNEQFDLDPGALDLVSDRPNGIERPLQMTDCLLVGTAAQGLGGGALMVRDRAHKLVAALEMLRQLRRDRVQPADPGGFEPAADACMAQGAACRRQAVVQELAVEIVPEGIKLRARAIRPSGRSRLDDEHALPRQTRAGGLDLLDVDLQRGRDGGGREFAADDARGRQQVAVALVELVDLPIDEASHIMRDRHDCAERPPGSFSLRQLVDDAGHEQRIAARPLQQQRRHLAQLRPAVVVVPAELSDRFRSPAD